MTQLDGVRHGAMSPYTVSLTPAAITSAKTAEQSFTGQVCVAGDCGMVIPPSITAAASPVYFRCATTGTLIICWVNATAGSLTPDAGVYTLIPFAV